MLPDRVSNPGPLTYESGVLPIALRGPALYGIKSRGNNSKTKNARVVFLNHDTSSYCDVCTCEVS